MQFRDDTCVHRWTLYSVCVGHLAFESGIWLLNAKMFFAPNSRNHSAGSGQQPVGNHKKCFAKISQPITITMLNARNAKINDTEILYSLVEQFMARRMQMRPAKWTVQILCYFLPIFSMQSFSYGQLHTSILQFRISPKKRFLLFSKYGQTAIMKKGTFQPDNHLSLSATFSFSLSLPLLLSIPFV